MAKFKKGRSGNPSGRRKGTGTRLFKQALLEELMKPVAGRGVTAEIDLQAHLPDGLERVVLTINSLPHEGKVKPLEEITEDDQALAVYDAATRLIHYMETGDLTGDVETFPPAKDSKATKAA